MANTQEQVTIDGTVYNVAESWTPERLESERGHVGTAAQMRKVGSTRHLWLTRPRGKVIYFVAEFAHKNSGKTFFGNVVSMGR